jgi:hypothetical protein
MATNRFANWEASDYQSEFRRLAGASSDAAFREKFNALADQLEPLGREFIRESASCGHDLSAVMDELQGIAARERYCDRPRGFERECEILYGDVERAIQHVQEVRTCCFV